MDFTDGVIIYYLLLNTLFYMCKYSLATRDTTEMTTKMAEAGADAALVVTPCFYKNGMTSDALEKHFTKVSLVWASDIGGEGGQREKKGWLGEESLVLIYLPLTTKGGFPLLYWFYVHMHTKFKKIKHVNV